ncbi:MAG: bifunctional DNA-formamidopyrimidine glycosylase/DNA-(apurinic or apyrimidinic site) lyase [Gammaproteobacteria bacterium]|nr:bifunctional DNA-formamidopyrimidine glycosylase/DNA-(apurinic or apyrimidinic site) lyase [Gammaproteobacteria bacterium]
MPELPEVETTRRGIAPHLTGRRIVDWQIRNAQLRWPVDLPAELRGQAVAEVARRAKYLLITLETGSLILHLGMSGSLRVLPAGTPPLKHDHVDLELDSGRVLRLNDPRRFGSLHWQPADAPGPHWLLARLGVEPLSEDFCGACLKRAARGRRVCVKNLLMDGRIVVGVGNIYANEALFMARIRPTLRASRVTLASYERLAAAVKTVLGQAIDLGGTTLRDFVNQDGQPGYFRQSLFVYGREGQPCKVCGTALRGLRLGQRASVFCPKCQRSQGFAAM